MSCLLHPPDGPRHLASAAEVRLYEALRTGLPDGWRAWHSVRLRQAGRWEGEGDFVIADPAHGLLVVEVKGGHLELRGGRWFQNGRQLDTPPRQQAQVFVRALAAEIRRRGAVAPPWEVACAFPDLDFSVPPGAGDLCGAVIGARDLPWLKERLPAILADALGDRRAPTSRAWLQKIDEIWGSTWIPRVTLGDKVEDAAHRRVALDEAQLQVLDLFADNRRALVEGGAGTGKTLLAREIAARAARAGQRALYVCFTDALARAVAHSVQHEGLPLVEAHAIRRYAASLVGGADRAPTREFWNEVSLRAACEALPASRPDLVIVDEAQDLEENDWLLVEALAGDGRLWIFADGHQRFWAERQMPERLTAAAARLKLPRQHRNPPSVEAFAALYLEDRPVSAPASRPPAPDDALRLVVAADPLARLRHEVDELRRGGARPQDIAILTLAGQRRSHLLGLERLGTTALVRADAPAAAEHVVADTFLRFKGLDRPFVLLVEPLHGPGMKYPIRMHIALTRATVGVTVVCDEEAVTLDPLLGSLRSAGSA